jgi:hypothetical protein
MHVNQQRAPWNVAARHDTDLEAGKKRGQSESDHRQRE